MRVGVADFGLNVWYGGLFDLEQRLQDLKRIGYQGIERLEAATEGELIAKAALFRKYGMDFATCRGPNVRLSLQWTAAVGKPYIWAMVSGRDFDTFCRQVEEQAGATLRWGVKTVVHNHMGTPVETQEQVEAFLERCPKAWLLLDTAHLAGAGGDPLAIVQRYPERIEAVHAKDRLADTSREDEANWTRRGRFCELGAGNIGLDNKAIIAELKRAGYEGWVFVEQDTHLQDPLVDLAKSRKYLEAAGI